MPTLSTFDSTLTRHLFDRLAGALDEKSAALVAGFAEDYASYRERVGEIAGLRMALAILDEQRQKALKE